MERVQMKYGWAHGVMIIVVLVTAAIHLYLGLKFSNPLFLLNAFGFVGLTGVYLLPISLTQRFHSLVRWGLVGYSLLTIVLWAVMNGRLDPVGITAKLAEIILIILLILDRKAPK
jgi:hypothetical protein